MVKAALSDDVVKVAIWAILIGGIYLVWQTAQAGAPIISAVEKTGGAVQKPFTWFAEGAEWWAEGFGKRFNP